MLTTAGAAAESASAAPGSQPVARRQLALNALVQVLVLGLWFSASAVLPALRAEWGLDRQGGIWLTTTVQIGFALGAVVSAALNLADRVRPQVLLAASALLGAGATALIPVVATNAWAAAPLRLVVGIAMAGVYPVGLKLVVSWFPRARGAALGVLIGALSLGSATPQLLTALPALDWRRVLLAASALAVLGAAVALGFVRAGPDAAPSPPLQPRYVLQMFADRPQRLVNLGYFGHMWELYALWAWLPAYLAAAFAAGAGAASDEAVATLRGRRPDVTVETVPDANHYTVVLDARHAATVAARITAGPAPADPDPGRTTP